VANKHQGIGHATTPKRLSIENLEVSFRTEDGVVRSVRGVDIAVNPGEIVAVVGESGSGKSVTALSVLGLHPKGRTDISGAIRWGEEDLLSVSEHRLQEIRGNEIAMIFQDPLTALNPVYTVGHQIAEAVRAHRSLDRGAAEARAIEMLELVGIPQPAKRSKMFPHEFSGGMRQRAMIAMALSCDPSLIIADEPTTALDVTVQAQILDLLTRAAREVGSSVMLITHDLGVVAGMADGVSVMYAGRVVERGTVDELFSSPGHPYAIGLLRSLPRIDADGQEELVPIGGQPPSMLNPPAGCAFHPRCPMASAAAGCDTTRPVLAADGHGVACLRSSEVLATLGEVIL
jgi:oligopeptide/dipeptide ABC transporter ATP-binding protein